VGLLTPRVGGDPLASVLHTHDEKVPHNAGNSERLELPQLSLPMATPCGLWQGEVQSVLLVFAVLASRGRCNVLAILLSETLTNRHAHI